MSITYTYTRQVNDGVNVLAYQDAVAAGESLNIDQTFTTGTTNQQLTSFAFVKTKLQAVFIVSDQNITIKTNSSGSPQETISLVANQPYFWTTNGYFANPFGGDVTTAYVTNSSGSTATLKVRGQITPV